MPRETWCLGRPFVRGINLPWLDYGHDFGANAWRTHRSVSQAPHRYRDTLRRLADDGYQAVRWFVLCDGRAGVITTDGGAPAGLDDLVRHDVDAAISALDDTGLGAVFVLADFALCGPATSVDGVQLGGRSAWLLRPSWRTRLIELVLAPLVAQAGAAAPILAWDLLNEPEWATWGLGGQITRGAVPLRVMRRFLESATSAVHAVSPAPVTVGLASPHGLPLVRGIGLDMYQVHWYDRHDYLGPLDTPTSAWHLDRPLLLGEFPTRGSARASDDIEATARRAGYCGAFAWSACAVDESSAPSVRPPGSLEPHARLARPGAQGTEADDEGPA